MWEAEFVTNSTVDNRQAAEGFSTNPEWDAKKPALGWSWSWVPSTQLFLHDNVIEFMLVTSVHPDDEVRKWGYPLFLMA